MTFLSPMSPLEKRLGRRLTDEERTMRDGDYLAFDLHLVDSKPKPSRAVYLTDSKPADVSRALAAARHSTPGMAGFLDGEKSGSVSAMAATGNPVADALRFSRYGS